MDRKFIKLKKWSRSGKDYKHLFGATQPLPLELLFLTPILTQDAENCTAFASVSIRQSMKGKTYDPQWQWAHELQFEGITSAPDGVDFKTPLAVGVKMGFQPLGQPLSGDNASSYFFVSKSSGLDLYDSIKQAINSVQAPLFVGLDWFASWDVSGGIVPNENIQLLGGHCTKIAGWKQINGTEYLVIQNSWGIDYGDNGLFYFSRELVNANFGTYGIAYWSDNQTQQIKTLEWFQALCQNLIALMQTFLQKNQTIATYPPAKTYYWSTPFAAEHSVRLICDEEGLSVEQKNILDACVHVESGYNPLAEHMNKDKEGNVWSTDYGICQINDYFNIGEGKPFPSTQYVLDNPEACIRWMCKQFLAGNQHLWASYTSGAYLKYLQKVVTQ